MGQKVNPISFRLVRNKKWRSLWYAGKAEFGTLLIEDQRVRELLRTKPSCQGASRFTIKRTGDKMEITIHTARPGLVIGKKGAELEVLRDEIRKMTGREVWIEIDEIKRPDLDAYLVAEAVAKQLERRVSFRRAMKRAMKQSMDAGAVGIKIQCAGRLGGAEIARTEWYKEGRIPLHTIRADIDYAMGRAETTYGWIGIKVWINIGEDIGVPAVSQVAPVVPQQATGG